MKNKGFTLIELLAVIVILAVISLIATPMILNMIENAKVGAAKDSAYGYIDAIEKNNALADFNEKYTKIEDGTYSDFEKLSDVKVKGKVPDYIEYIILKGRVTKAGMCINNINIDYINNEAKKSETDYCKFVMVNSIKINNKVSSIENGETLQLDITVDPSDVTPSYISSDETVATISNNGLIEAKQPGKTIISVKAGVKVEKFELNVVKVGPTQELPTGDETYKAIVYLDPTNLTKKCDATNSVSITGTKTGCMKWYVYKDDGTNYTMILDHNTTPLVAYNSEGSSSKMKEVQDELDKLGLESKWKQTARLITADEVAEITGANEKIKWNSSKNYGSDTGVNDIETQVSWFFLDGIGTTYSNINGWQKQVATSKGASKYAWLHDNIGECINYGCNISDENIYLPTENKKMFGYWTSSNVAGKTNWVWRILKGRLDYGDVDRSNLVGIRPVITISKSIIING